MKFPATVIFDLLKSNNGMIGLLELLAVLLVISTWHSNKRSARWEAHTDNDGVLFAIINAVSNSAHANRIVGLLWRRLHAMSTNLTAFRVESKANVGDAGSRIPNEGFARPQACERNFCTAESPELCVRHLEPASTFGGLHSMAVQRSEVTARLLLSGQ